MTTPHEVHGIKANRAADGFWYIEVKTSLNGQYKRDSRYPNFDRAIERIVALGKKQPATSANPAF